LKLFGTLRRQYPSSCPGGVGIITAYKSQKHLLQKIFKKQFGHGMGGGSGGGKKGESGCDVEISTIDGFQGREKDVIIFSCVRASSSKPSHQVGMRYRPVSFCVPHGHCECMFLLC
jgi:senataxin